MSRNTKDSDDEMEAKSGRKTRAALYQPVSDSPLRRSSRIKHTVQQDSSPESVNDVPNSGLTRNTRSRTTTADSTETIKNSRTRRNSAASDISELTETESLADGPTKRTTRRSVTGVPAAETLAKLNERSRRATRAGSESKSTPPVSRTTRRTRATSLEPEITDEEKVREVGTPIKTRRRASVLPSEPAVAEESEDSGNGRRAVDKTVYEIDEDECVFVDSGSPNTSASSRRKSKSDANDSVEKMEVDESPVKKSEDNTIERSARDITETNNSHVTKMLDESSSQQISSKGSPHTIENILSYSTDKNPSNKENELLNDSVSINGKTSRSSDNDVRFSSRKFSNSLIVKPHEKRQNISIDDPLSNNSETQINSSQEVNRETAKKPTILSNRRERYSVEECVVVIEPMEMDRIEKHKIVDKTSSAFETPQRRKEDDKIDVIDLEEENVETDGYKSLGNETKVEDNEVKKDVENETMKRSSIEVIADDKQEEKMDESEVDVELKLQLDDPISLIEETPIIESVHNDKESPESSTLTAEPLISADQDEIVKNNDKTSAVIRESLINEAHSEVLIDKTPLNQSLSSNLESIVSSSTINNENPINNEINCDDIEENLIVAKDRKSSIVTESPGTNDEDEASIAIEEKSRKSISNRKSLNPSELNNTRDGVEEKSSRKSISSGRSSNANELTSTNDLIEEKSRKSTSNRRSTNPSESNDTSDVAEEKSSRKSTLSGRSSNANELTSTNDSIEEKSRKSTSNRRSTNPSESNETSDVVEEKSSRKSTLSGRSSNANELTSTNDSIEEKSRKSTSNRRSTNPSESNETSDVVEEKSSRKSILSGRSSNANELTSSNDSIEEKSRKSTSNRRSTNPSESNETSDVVEEKSSRKSIPSGRSSNANELTSTDDLIEEKSRKSTSNGRSSNASELKSPSDVIEEKSSRKSILSKRSSNANDLTSTSEVTEEKSRKSTSNGRSSNASDLKITSDEIEEKSSRKSVSSRKSSNANELTSTSDGIEDKPRKSISNGRSSNASELKITEDAIEEKSPRKSISSGRSSNANELTSTTDEIVEKSSRKSISSGRLSNVNTSGEKSPEKKIADSKKVQQSDDESEYEGIPTFKDIPATEWTNDGNSETSQKDNDDNKSVDSMSTEYNNDECNVVIGDKKISQALEPETEEIARSDYDSDDTVKNAVPTRKSVGNAEKEGFALNEVTSMIMSIDGDGENIIVNKEVVKRRSDLNHSKNIKETKNTPSKKKVSLINDSDKNSPIQTREDKDNHNTINDSASKPLKKRSLNRSAIVEAGNEQIDNSNVKTPKNLNRKSLDGSGKKTLDTSKTNVSSKNTPKKSNETSLINWSLTKLQENSDSDDTEDVTDGVTSPAMNKSTLLNKSEISTSAKKSKLNKSVSKIGEVSSTASSPQLELNKSLKSASAKKSKLNKSAVKSDEIIDALTPTSSESDSSPDELSKNDSMLSESPLSPDAEDELLETSIESGDAKKSPKNQENSRRLSASAKKFENDKNYSTIAQVNSDSELDEDSDEDSSDDMEISREIPKFLYDPRSSSDSSSISDDDDSTGSIDSDIKRDLNLDGDSVVEYSDDDVPADDCLVTESDSSDNEDDGSDLIDFVVEDDEDDEDEESENDVAEIDDGKTAKSRKRIIPRPERESDSSDSETDEEPINVSSTLDKSKTAKTPIKESNKSLEIIESKNDINESVKILSAKKNKNLDIQSSTPKNLLKKNLLPETMNPPKSATPLNKSLKESSKLNTSKKLSKSLCEKVDTPAKLSSNSKASESTLSVDEQLQTSLPVNLSDSIGKNKLSKEKSAKVKILNKTLVPAGTESSETRFLMKEKLNDSLPAMKLSKSQARRMSALENLEEKVDEEPEVEKMQTEKTGKRASLGKEVTAILPEVSSEKKKKKKRQLEDADASVVEIGNTFDQSVLILDDSVSKKKSKKLKKQQKIVEETSLNEEEKMEDENIESPEKDKKKKKKKKKNRQSVESAEPEVAQNDAAKNVATSDSDDEPTAIDFETARNTALESLRKVAESIKTNQEKKRKDHQKLLLSSREDRKSKGQTEKVESVEKTKTSIKRLPEDVLEMLSDVATRPQKRRKLSKDEKKILPSTSMFGTNPQISNFTVDDGYIPLSSAGGTTQFTVVNLKKAVKHSRKAAAAVSFRERMLARNPRQPISAYLMYQQKQKASAKGRPY